MEVVMRKVIGICNLHNEPSLGGLTENRPLGAVTFLGRYGLIDFTLSNFSNSHIDRVYVLIRNGVVAIKRHVGSGSIWTNNTRLGFIELLLNEKGVSNQVFNTDINNIKANIPLDELDFEYAVVAPSYMLSSMDFRPIIAAHEKSGAEITCVYKHIENADQEFIRMDKYKVTDGKITKSTPNIGRNAEADISLRTYVISKKTLEKMLKDSAKINNLFSIKDLINLYIDDNSHLVCGYEFTGYVVPILSLKDYVTHSLDLLNYHIRSQLFLPEWPIYTTTHNTPPALYGKDADVQNSFIANGAIIKGKVRNSIISRDVVVEKGADLKNCIIFTKTEIGKDVKLEYVLSDKNAKIKDIDKINGQEDNIVYIPQGAKI